MMWTVLYGMVKRSVRKQAVPSIVVLLSLLTAGQADNDHDIARRLRKTGDIVPLEQIVKTLGEAREVRILEIALQERAGRLIYRVEYIDPNGVVVERQYDAKSGAILKTRESE